MEKPPAPVIEAAVRPAPPPDPETQDKYLRDRLEDQISWHERKSGWNQRWYRRLRGLEILLAASIPLAAAILVDGLPARRKVLIVGLSVAIAAVSGLLSLWRFQENWADYRKTSESLRRIKYLFATRTPPFDGPDAFHLLVQQVEAQLTDQTASWSESARKSVAVRKLSE